MASSRVIQREFGAKVILFREEEKFFLKKNFIMRVFFLRKDRVVVFLLVLGIDSTRTGSSSPLGSMSLWSVGCVSGFAFV